MAKASKFLNLLAFFWSRGAQSAFLAALRRRLTMQNERLQHGSRLTTLGGSPSAGALVLAALTARSNRKPQTQRSHAKERQTWEPLVSGRPRPAVAIVKMTHAFCC